MLKCDNEARFCWRTGSGLEAQGESSNSYPGIVSDEADSSDQLDDLQPSGKQSTPLRSRLGYLDQLTGVKSNAGHEETKLKVTGYEGGFSVDLEKRLPANKLICSVEGKPRRTRH